MYHVARERTLRADRQDHGRGFDARVHVWQYFRFKPNLNREPDHFKVTMRNIPEFMKQSRDFL